MADNIRYESEARGTARPERPSPREASVRQASPPTAGERLHRRRRIDDPLYYDPRIVPPGLSYEWKRDRTAGKPDNSHWIQMRENHWRPVPASRHPELALGDDTVIRRDDVVLCERPSYLTEEAQLEDINLALDPVQKKEELLYGTKPNEFTRDHPSVRRVAGINREYGPGYVPGGRGTIESEP